MTGRSDKRFCDSYCRNSYNNNRYREENKYEIETNIVLHQNRKILQETGADGKTRFSEEELLRKGFSFKYFTGIFESHTGTKYYFCYDYGYVQLEKDSYVVIKRQEYMD